MLSAILAARTILRSLSAAWWVMKSASARQATVAATQATTVANDQQLHYLRTTNPFNPENLAVYPRRLGTNRPNAYTKPNAFDIDTFNQHTQQHADNSSQAKSS